MENRQERPRLCDETCSICCDTMEAGAAGVVTLFCGHKFHAQCICDWMQLGKTACPYCRQRHPDHQNVASTAGTQELQEEEDEFSDSASEHEDFAEVQCLLKAKEDSDPVVHRLYESFAASSLVVQDAVDSVSKQRMLISRERSKLRKRLLETTRKGMREGMKLIRNGPVGKEYNRALRRSSYARKRYRLKRRRILDHYAASEAQTLV